MILKIRFFFQALYYIWKYGSDDAEKILKGEISKISKETRLLEKITRKAINESKGGKMCKRPTR